jgi:hypothetical protein
MVEDAAKLPWYERIEELGSPTCSFDWIGLICG